MLLYIIPYFKLNITLCYLLFYIIYNQCRDLSLDEQKRVKYAENIGLGKYIPSNISLTKVMF